MSPLAVGADIGGDCYRDDAAAARGPRIDGSTYPAGFVIFMTRRARRRPFDRVRVEREDQSERKGGGQIRRDRVVWLVRVTPSCY